MSHRPPPPGGPILVVDDSELNRDMLSRRLKRKGFTVDTAADGDAALEAIAAGTYGLVLLDIMMPGIDGLEVLRRVRADKPQSELPIIMATAKDTTEDIVEALRLGANDYVTKPLDFPVVLARVQTQLALKAAHDEVERKNAFIREVFGRYLTDNVVDALLDTPEGLRFGGETREVTVLMSDLRGFSSLCERLQPGEVVEILNVFLGAMSEVINARRGTIDEFIGDAILAIFGAPLPLADHRRAAIEAALGMQRAMAGVNATLAERGLPTLEMGIGLNTGEVVVGNIGSVHRAKYGVVGAPVNLTARIESFTVGGQVLASQATVAPLLSELDVAHTFEVEAKGVDGPFAIHDVRGVKGAPELSLHDDAGALVTLAAPLEVAFVVLEGKQVGRGRRQGRFVSLDDKGGRLAHEGAPLPVLGNLKLGFPAANISGDLYGKVLKVEGSVATVRFTSIPPDVAAWLAAARAGA